MRSWLPQDSGSQAVGGTLLEETGSSTEPTLVTFLPWLQSPSSHSFLTKEELLQRCTQKAPKVSTDLGGEAQG